MVRVWPAYGVARGGNCERNDSLYRFVNDLYLGHRSADNRRIITMEWIVEGIALVSVAVFVAVATIIDRNTAVSYGVYAVAIGTLVVLAVVSVFTGFRIAFLPFRLCPFIFGLSAVLVAIGAWW